MGIELLPPALGMESTLVYDAVAQLFYSTGLDRFVNMATCDPLYSSLAVSVAINEALELVRFPLVAITTPYVVRFVRRWFPK